MSLNTLFVRYGCGTERQHCPLRGRNVLIPYSSGMGVGQLGLLTEGTRISLNTLFVRYGCGTGPLRPPNRFVRS